MGVTKEKLRITTRWEIRAKTVKGETTARARYVAREFKTADPWRTDLFAPSSGVSTSRVVDALAVRNDWPTMGVDISSAFFHAPEKTEVYVEPPVEWVEVDPENRRDTLWRLRKQLHGRRKAPQEWLEHAAGVLKQEGFRQCAEMPCFFHHSSKDVTVELHRTTSTRRGPGLNWSGWEKPSRGISARTKWRSMGWDQPIPI